MFVALEIIEQTLMLTEFVYCQLPCQNFLNDQVYQILVQQMWLEEH